MKESIAALLEILVSHRSVDGEPGEKARVLHFARAWLESSGVQTQWHDHHVHPSLIATIPGSGKPVLLLAHLDVVPAPETMFAMRREGDKVFGRGVLDDKGPAAVLMHLMASLAKNPGAAAILVLSTDEEIGSDDGVRRLVEAGLLDGPRCVIAMDGGSETRVVIREKGVLHLTLQATGKTAHNSTPWEGDNAVEKMWRTYERIKMELHEESDPSDRWKCTVSVGAIGGGQFVNQVPGSAEMKVDIRFTDDRRLEEVEKTVNDALEEGVRVLGASGGHPFETDDDDPLLADYAKSMSHAFGAEMELVSEHGATDARFFRSMNVPIWLHYPKGGDIHTDDEWMDLASAERLLAGLEAFARSI